VTAPRPLIAIVDDEESVRRALKRLVATAGLDVETFGTGEEFLNAIRSRRPDCAVLDLHMPAMTGFEIQSRLSEAGAVIPVIVMTGRDTPDAGTRAMEGGASAFLRKPIKSADLLDAIVAAIGRQPT
jgi:FixJ family two-component response regulator